MAFDPGLAADRAGSQSPDGVGVHLPGAGCSTSPATASLASPRSRRREPLAPIAGGSPGPAGDPIDARRGTTTAITLPGGRRTHSTSDGPGDLVRRDVWLARPPRGTLSRVTFGGYRRGPVWRRDGQPSPRLAGARRQASICREAADGAGPAELDLVRAPNP